MRLEKVLLLPHQSYMIKSKKLKQFSIKLLLLLLLLLILGLIMNCSFF